MLQQLLRRRRLLPERLQRDLSVLRAADLARLLHDRRRRQPQSARVCQDKGAASCGTNGKCDGTGSCATYAKGTVCASETCASGLYTAASTCNTTGQCVAPDARPCAPFVCNGSQCFNVCATSDQCKTPNTCKS